jgi:hypothetical protein
MSETIPTSNKPGSEKKDEKEEKKNLMDDVGFQKTVTDTIAKVKTMVDEVESVTTKTEELKIVSLFKVGDSMNKLLEQLGPRERKLIVDKFHKEIGMDVSFFYLAMQINTTFTKEQLEAMKKNGVTVQVVKALVAVKDDKMREKALNKALTEGITADEIRQLKGTKGSRQAAMTKKKREADKKKPPLRVFTQGLDRIIMVEETLGSCTDAVTRLAECKTEDERKDAVKVLVEMRKKLPDIVNELNSFLKFTASVSKPASK